MPDPETQLALPEPGAAPDMPSVNPEDTPIADSESQTTNWVDPIFLERDSAPLPDEIVIAGSEEAAEAAAAENESESPSAEQLAKLVSHFNEGAESDDTAGKPAKAAEKAKEEPAEKARDDKDGIAAGSEDADGADAGSKDADGGDAGSVSTDSEKSPTRRERRASDPAVARRQQRHIDSQARTIEALQAQIEQGTPAVQAEPAEPEVPAEPPTLENHDFDTDKWATAMGEWTKATVAASEQKAAQARDEEAGKAAAARNQEVMETFHGREETIRDRHDDYDEVVYDTSIFIAPSAAAVIWQSEHGPEIAYHLATHQDEAKAMAEMSEVDIGRALAKIEFTLTAEQAAHATEIKKAAQAAPTEKSAENTEAETAEQALANEPARQAQPVPTPTKAPPPVPTLGGSGAAMRPNVENMSMDEYRAGRLSGKIR